MGKVTIPLLDKVTGKLPARVLPDLTAAVHEAADGVYNAAALPAYAGVRTKPFDPALSLYNATAANARTVRTKASGTRQGDTLRISCIGDSTTSGDGSGDAGTASWPIQLTKMIEAAGAPIRGTGLAFAGGTNTDSRWAQTGTVFGFGQTAQMSSGATRAFTAERPGSTVEIRFRRYSANFGILIDGAAPASGSVTVSGGTYSGGTITPDGVFSGAGLITVTGLTDTVHVVQVTASGGGDVFFIGVDAHRSAGVQLTNAGIGGTLTSDWASTGVGTAFQGATLEPVDFFIVMLGTNDAVSGNAATFRTNLTSVLAHALAVAPVLLVGQPNRSTVAQATWEQQFLPVLYDAADAFDVRLLDLQHRWGSYTLANGLGLLADGVHPNAKGYADIAQAIYAACGFGVPSSGVSGSGGGGGVGVVDNGDGTFTVSSTSGSSVVDNGDGTFTIN